MLFCSGTNVKMKVAKMCNAFDATWYSIPKDPIGEMKDLSRCKNRPSDQDVTIESEKTKSRYST